jgi:hypothetical protein
MRAQDPTPQVTAQEPVGTPSASGPGVFAGTMMVVAGIWHGLIGFAGLVHDTLFVRVDGYVYTFDITGWGWVHLLLGAVVVVVGLMVRRGMPWAPLSGLVLVGTSMVVNFLFLPYQPAWSVLVIGLDIAIIVGLVMDKARRAHTA